MAELTSPTKAGYSLNNIIPNITAGLVTGFFAVIMAISLASLIFSGPLESLLPRGIALALITSIIHMSVNTLLGRFDGVVSIMQDNPAVLIAISAGTLATMGLGNATEATIFAFIFLSTLLTGAFLMLLGRFKLGGLVRYIPYPVVGGFLAGSGWLLLKGGIRTMSDYDLTLANLPAMFTPEQLEKWLPGVVFAVILFLGIRYIRHKLTFPAMIIAGLILFYLVLLLTGTSIDEATRRGLLLGQIGDSAVWHPLPLTDLTQANWGALFSQAGTIGTILALAAISLLLNVSGLELALRRDIDLNHELQLTGVANILSALAGGSIGYHALGQTSLCYRLDARGKTMGLMTIGILILILLIGSSIIAYIPKLILGGLVVLSGLDFLFEWAIESRKKLMWYDYAVVLIILLVIALAGFLTGVAIGLVLMIGLFVINYSRLNLFYRTTSGAEVTSHVVRSVHHQRALADLGKRVSILELQGFIFFGTANAILERIRQRLLDRSQVKIQYLIVDFRRVTGLDSSASFCFTKVKHLAETENFVLIFTHLAPMDQRELTRGGLEKSDHIKFFRDLDHALEWCEDQLLEISQITKIHFPTTLALQLADSGFEKDDTKRLQTYLEPQQFAPGDYVIRQGNEAKELFFVEIGQVSVYLELENSKRMRLRTYGMGTIVGELGFFLNVPRSASVIADLNTIAYSLNAQALETMMEKDPPLAIAFHSLMVRLLSERLVAATDELASLNR